MNNREMLKNLETVLENRDITQSERLRLEMVRDSVKRDVKISSYFFLFDILALTWLIGFLMGVRL